jgi:aldose 1-epimerase
MIKQIFLKKLKDKDIFSHEFVNNNGASIAVTNYGATVTSIKVPDRKGHLTEITLGFDNIDSYIGSHPYFGSTIGRYANRIANGKFTLNGKQYILDCNDGKNHLHGGYSGFDKAIWESEINKEQLAMHYSSIDGDQGYPGNLDVYVTFKFNNNNEFDICYRATSETDTIINLTNHTYFNLSGCSQNILGHELKIYANLYTPVLEGGIPTGEIADVSGTPMDFLKMTRIGQRINDDFEQLKLTGGYDHNYIPDKTGLCAEAIAPESGITLQVFTNKPGLQFYSGNYLEGIAGRDDVKYTKNFGFCLETQFFPDSPNKDNFPDCVLKKGEVYCYKTTYRFGAD